jgi:hypothetical protein
MLSACRCINCLTPPHLLRKLAESDDRDIRERALNTLLTSATIRGERNVRSLFGDASPSEGRRTYSIAGRTPTSRTHRSPERRMATLPPMIR